MIRLLILKIFNKTLSFKGSTLIETIVAMTILLTVVTVFFTSGDRIEQSLNPDKTYKAWLITNEIFNSKSLLSKDETEFAFKGFIIEKITKSFKDSELSMVTINVRSSDGKVIYTRRKLISNRIEI